MKRILLISFEYPIGRTYCGGVGQIVKQSREVLMELGYEVYVLISSQFQKKYPVKLLLPDNCLIRYPNFWIFQRQHEWQKFNHIVHHFVNWTRELKRLKNHKVTRPRIIYHFHSILRREKDSGFKTFNQFLLNQERMIEIADRIICPSRYEYDNFIRYFPYFSEKVTLIENTLETFPFMKDEVQKIKTQHNIKKNDIVSIYVGRLERIKGAHILIQYLSKILNRHKNLKFFIVGKALEKNLYRKLMNIQKRFPHQLFYLKYIEKNKLFQYYYLSHIYINTSLSESFSLTTHESAFCKNALLLNSLPVFRKFEDSVLFFSQHDTNGVSFFSRYEQLIRDRRLRAKLSKKAYRVTKDFLSRNRLKQDFPELFKIV
ncbi:MAG: glycosyltransferase family 4 protein [Candidatus Omnitrophica bacterium]|nr:glycosyltransferase family 4 protein [Candidatus Omnitrophota bacterium]